MPNLHAFDMLGNSLGKRIRPCAELYSAMADLLADRFDVEVDRIDFDNREDGSTYITCNGEIVGYVLLIDPDGGWRQPTPARLPLHHHANDNRERLTSDLALVRRVMAEEVTL